MIRFSKVRVIARFEFAAVVRRVSFLLVTFGLPLFFATVSGGLMVSQMKFLVEQMSQVGLVGVVDASGELAGEAIWVEPGELEDAHRALVEQKGLEGARFLALDTSVFVRMDSREEAIEGVRSGLLDEGAYLLPEDYLQTGHITYYAFDETGATAAARRAAIDPTVEHLLRDRILRDYVPEEVRTRVLDPVDIERVVIAADGTERSNEKRNLETAFRIGVPFFLGAFLLTALLFSSGYLVQTVALDKESKIVEVLLSSADPNEILLGKLIGLGGAGLLQFFVWSAMVLVAAVGLAYGLDATEITLPWLALSLSPLFFVLGYLFIGSLMLATGSLGADIAESQKLTMGWAILALMPLLVLLRLIEEPHGALAHFLSIVPFSSPLTLVVRLSVDPEGVNFGDIALSITSLLLATWLSIRIGARVFRLGFLLTGTRPSWREIMRQAKLID